MEHLINQWEQKLYKYRSILGALKAGDMSYWKGKISALEIAIEELRNATGYFQIGQCIPATTPRPRTS